MKKTQNQPFPPPVIGLPNALLYHRYAVLWERFFTHLGAEVIVSEATNKELLQKGMELSIDESCLSAKIYLGHVHSLIGRCDYILVPRINSWGRQRAMCTRFASQYDLVCNVFRSTGQRFLCYNVDVPQKQTEEDAFLEMGTALHFPKKAVADAYKNAKKEETADWKNRVRFQEQLYKSDGFKIMIASHSYILDDAYFGKPITDYLKALGVTPIRADITDRREALKQSLKVSPTLKWEVNREIVGNLWMHRDRIDGIILISAFPCGPDSMVNEIISRSFNELPVLNLVLDSQTGAAGIETRLESFVDILRLKKGTL